MSLGTRPRKPRRWAAWTTAFALAIGATVAAAPPTVYREHDIKAAFLFRFLQLVDWPSTAFASVDAPIVIGIVAPDPFGPVLEHTVADERVDGRPILVKRAATAAAALPCHLLFIPRPAPGTPPPAVPAPPPAGVLLVGETPDFIDRGGMISFFPESNRVRFEISPQNAELAGIRIRSRLLRLARVVPELTATSATPPLEATP